jgi:hypothetical protein
MALNLLAKFFIFFFISFVLFYFICLLLGIITNGKSYLLEHKYLINGATEITIIVATGTNYIQSKDNSVYIYIYIFIINITH